MRLKYFEYVKLVVEDYNSKRDVNSLSTRLVKPTPAGLKKECLMLFEENRYEHKDESALRTFFGPISQGKDLKYAMETIDTSRFKPLVNYLNGETVHTEHKNLELLAWLLAFEHRPFNSDKEIQLTNRQLAILNVNDSFGQDLEDIISPNHENAEAVQDVKLGKQPVEWENEEVPTLPFSQSPAKMKRHSYAAKAGIALLSLAIGAGGIYAIRSANEGVDCMYWTGDHYEKISCEEKPGGRDIVRLDEDQLGVQKITREDSINEQHIGQIYYIKDKNDIQYFTKEGKYPTDWKRDLQKLSRRIFDKDSINRRSASVTRR